MIGVKINGATVEVPDGATVAAAILLHGESTFRLSRNGEPRGPVCGMGICFECRVTVDRVPHARSCQLLCGAGMEIETAG